MKVYTEGLLLDLDLRDLQKSGRIGRIEVKNESEGGISKGTIVVPSSLTRKETALLAATIETVNRVGPCEAEIILLGIKDIREKKRKKIIERAAELLKEWDQKSLDANEIEEQIDTDIKLGEIVLWGPEKLPAGPNVETDDELIIVEGRADVLNLLRVGVKNTIAVQGTSVPKSVIDLVKKKKSVTAYLDGDRGGTLILKELLQITDINFVARAPEGFEVEELTRKQLIKSLQSKSPIKDGDLIESFDTEKEIKKSKEEYTGSEKVLNKFLKKQKVKNRDILIHAVRDIGTGIALAYDKDLNILFQIPVSKLYDNIEEYSEIQYLILHGILSQRLLDKVKNMNLKLIACKNKVEDLKVPNDIFVYYF